MSRATDPDLLVLHAVRTLGYADVARLADRLDLSEDDVSEHLLDAQAFGWVTWLSFAGDGGWSLTEAGRVQGEQRLAAELDAADARAVVEEVYRRFLPVNTLVAQACTDRQLAELGVGGEPVSLDATLAALGRAADVLAELESVLTGQLERFRGYHSRFTTAILRASDDAGWITGTDRDSAHRVWFELHEDLIATLGLTR